MQPSQQLDYSPKMGGPYAPMAPLEFDSNHSIHAPATYPAPLPTMNFDPSAHMQPILPAGTSHVDPAAVGRIHRTLAQERRIQTRWQQQAQHRLQNRQQQAQQKLQQLQRARIDQQQHYRQDQSDRK